MTVFTKAAWRAPTVIQVCLLKYASGGTDLQISNFFAFILF